MYATPSLLVPCALRGGHSWPPFLAAASFQEAKMNKYQKPAYRLGDAA